MMASSLEFVQNVIFQLYQQKSLDSKIYTEELLYEIQDAYELGGIF